MKIALAQLNYHIGNFEGNLEKMLGMVTKAKALKADIVVFGELATCGYPPRDFLEFDDFIRKAYASVGKLAEVAQGIAIVVGSPSRNPKLEGKDLFNSAFFLADGQIQHVQHKTLLPTYDIFDEYRYFEPADSWKTLTFKGKKIALTVCEDIWNVGNENPLYRICPMDEMMDEQPDLMLNLSASPFSYDHAPDRIHVLKANVARYKVPVFYANQSGGQTDIIFDGGSIVMSPDGNVFDEMPYFEECLRVYDLDTVIRGGVSNEQPKEKIKLIHDALIVGIQDYFRKMGLKKAILGLSGGIDSAVVAVLAARALGADNVRCILMPSQYSSDHSVNDARHLAENLGIQYDIIPIEPMFAAFEQTLKPHFWSYPQNITEENLQARIRGMLVMAFSNKFGNILLNTTNKSEMAVGYGTLYGDMCGGLSVIGDVYKMEVYELARFINKDGEIIPLSTIQKPPSAELRPNQKDSDSLPEYDVLDKVLFQYIEKRQGPKELIAMGFDEALVNRVLRLVNINEFKREQTAPVLRVSNKGFGMGRRMPIVGKYLS
ncbi:MAG: NAD+ synthase [Saprospiraceae bacterium]|nr:NAD+ synthase [Saprospiraceae bacterium]